MLLASSHIRLLERLALIVTVLCCFAFASFDAAAQERRAVITGADTVFVRYGPGMNFTPFARLNKETVVTIKGNQGEWVQIETASAQVGFVHSRYIQMLERDDALPATGAAEPPADAAADAPAVGETPAATPASPPLVAVSPPEFQADTLGSSDSDAPAPPPQLPMEAMDSAPRPSMADERAAITDEVRRLAAAVASLERRIADNEPIDNGFGASARADEDSGSLGSTVLLGLLCIGIGWYLGSRYGRAQERGLRARIRF